MCIEILTKRSGRAKDKENMSVNNKHNKLKKINEETLMQKKKKAKKDNPIERGEKRKVGNGKSSTASLHRLFRNEKSREEKSRRNRKSFSPNTELKNYRSGPENKNVQPLLICIVYFELCIQNKPGVDS